METLTNRKLRVYFAGPLFTQAEWQWNEALAAALEQLSLEIILPQKKAEPMLLGQVQFDPDALFHANINSIDNADIVVAMFEGVDIDSGTAWECGYAFKSGKPVIGVRSDIRAAGDDPRTSTNLMLSVSCAEVISIPLGNRRDVNSVAATIAQSISRSIKIS